MPYQDGDTLAVVRMSNKDGLVANEFVNTFAFRRTIVPAEADFLLMTQALNDFYNAPVGAGISISDFMGEAIDRAVTHVIDFYNIQVGALGSPVWSQPWLGPAAPVVTNNNLPTEVAAVLSFHADMSGSLEEVGVTRPRARRRGRVFLGCLTVAAINAGDDSPALATALTTAMRVAALALIDQGDITGNIWGVWSRADQEVRPIVGGWTDTACDTQRRRGPEATSRITYAA